MGYVLKYNIPVDKSVYVSTPDVLRGVKIKRYILHGTHYERKDIGNILLNLITAVNKSKKSILFKYMKRIKVDNEFEKMWNDVFENIV